MLYEKAVDFNPLSVNSIANSLCADLISMWDTDAGSECFRCYLQAVGPRFKEGHATLALTIDILCSIPRIGLLTAATIVAEIGDFSAFSKPDGAIGNIS